jgi:hypothetical protein
MVILLEAVVIFNHILQKCDDAQSIISHTNAHNCYNCSLNNCQSYLPKLLATLDPISANVVSYLHTIALYVCTP